VSEVFHFAKAPAPFGGRVGDIAPGHISYGSFATFKDPDGNGWVLQEVTTRLPGRVAGDTTYASVGDLSQALRRAEAAHGQHEKRTGQRDQDWPAWYAETWCGSSRAKSCRSEKRSRSSCWPYEAFPA
jgi:hypothetical protein